MVPVFFNKLDPKTFSMTFYEKLFTYPNRTYLKTYKVTIFGPYAAYRKHLVLF